MEDTEVFNLRWVSLVMVVIGVDKGIFYLKAEQHGGVNSWNENGSHDNSEVNFYWVCP